MASKEGIFKLAKVLHDADVDLCFMRAETGYGRFPKELLPHQYTVPQPYIDRPLAWAKAAFKYFEESK